MPTPKCCPTPFTSLSELRNQCIAPLLFHGQHRQFSTPAALKGDRELSNCETGLQSLTFTLGEKTMVLRLGDSCKHEENFAMFTDLLEELCCVSAEQLPDAAESTMGTLQEVESLMSSEAGRANLEALWHLWRRAVYSTQCDGRVLTPALLAGALHALLAPYVRHAQTLLEAAGAYLGLVVVGVVEPALEALADACQERERGAGTAKDGALACAYSRLGFQLRSLQSLLVRFVEDKRYAASPLLLPRDMGGLREQLGLHLGEEDGQGEGAAGWQGGVSDRDSAGSLEELMWHLHEEAPAELASWVEALMRALESAGGKDEKGRLLLVLGAGRRKSDMQGAVQSPEFLQAQEIALEVGAMAGITLDLADRLRALPTPAPPHVPPPSTSPGDDSPYSSTHYSSSPMAWPAGTSSPAAAEHAGHAGPHPLDPQRLLGVARTCLRLVGDTPRTLRTSGSAVLGGLVEGVGAVVQLAEEIERLEGRVRLEAAEARADRAELLCRELQLQAALQRKAHRDVLAAQQQLAMVWLSISEAQMDLSKAQRSCLEEATREFRAAAVQLTAPAMEWDTLGSGTTSP